MPVKLCNGSVDIGNIITEELDDKSELLPPLPKIVNDTMRTIDKKEYSRFFRPSPPVTAGTEKSLEPSVLEMECVSVSSLSTCDVNGEGE